MILIVDEFKKLHIFYNVQCIYEDGECITISDLNNGSIIYQNLAKNIYMLKIDEQTIISTIE